MDATDTSPAGLTVVEVVIALVVVATFVALGSYLVKRQLQAGMQAQADAAPGTVFQISVQPLETKVAINEPFTLRCTIDNPTRYDLDFRLDEVRFVLLRDDGGGSVLDIVDSWYIDALPSADNQNDTGGNSIGSPEVEIYDTYITVEIPAKESITFTLGGSFQSPGIYNCEVIIAGQSLGIPNWEFDESKAEQSVAALFAEMEKNALISARLEFEVTYRND